MASLPLHLELHTAVWTYFVKHTRRNAVARPVGLLPCRGEPGHFPTPLRTLPARLAICWYNHL